MLGDANAKSAFAQVLKDNLEKKALTSAAAQERRLARNPWNAFHKRPEDTIGGQLVGALGSAGSAYFDPKVQESMKTDKLKKRIQERFQAEGIDENNDAQRADALKIIEQESRNAGYWDQAEKARSKRIEETTALEANKIARESHIDKLKTSAVTRMATGAEVRQGWDKLKQDGKYQDARVAIEKEANRIKSEANRIDKQYRGNKDAREAAKAESDARLAELKGEKLAVEIEGLVKDVTNNVYTDSQLTSIFMQGPEAISKALGISEENIPAAWDKLRERSGLMGGMDLGKIGPNNAAKIIHAAIKDVDLPGAWDSDSERKALAYKKVSRFYDLQKGPNPMSMTDAIATIIEEPNQ